MKILILMPLDEQHVYAATGIYKNLSPELQNITLAMPMFMEYLVETHISPNWTYALFDTLISAKTYCHAAEQEKCNLIIIGNTLKDYQFDAVFNFQDIEEALPYKDNFIDHLLNDEQIKESQVLLQQIAGLHEAHESILSLINCKASAQFIEDYMKTDPQLDKITAAFDVEKFGKYLKKNTPNKENKDGNYTA